MDSYEIKIKHKGCGGTVAWEDVTLLDEGYVCERCGATYVDGEDMDATYRVL